MRGAGRAMNEPLGICFVFSHPDDEAFGVSGSMAKYAAQGVRVGLVCVTQGEAGLSNGLAGSPAALAQLRRAELSCAARTAGASELEILDYPDGGGASWDL